AGGLGQLAGQILAQSGQGPFAAGATDFPGGERHPHSGKSEARRARGEGRLRVRLRAAAAQDPGRFRLDGRAFRNPVRRSRMENEARRSFLKGAAATIAATTVPTQGPAAATGKEPVANGEKIISRPGPDLIVEMIKSPGIAYVAS